MNRRLPPIVRACMNQCDSISLIQITWLNNSFILLNFFFPFLSQILIKDIEKPKTRKLSNEELMSTIEYIWLFHFSCFCSSKKGLHTVTHSHYALHLDNRLLCFLFNKQKANHSLFMHLHWLYYCSIFIRLVRTWVSCSDFKWLLSQKKKDVTWEHCTVLDKRQIHKTSRGSLKVSKLW